MYRHPRLLCKSSFKRISHPNQSVRFNRNEEQDFDQLPFLWPKSNVVHFEVHCHGEKGVGAKILLCFIDTLTHQEIYVVITTEIFKKQEYNVLNLTIKHLNNYKILEIFPKLTSRPNDMCTWVR